MIRHSQSDDALASAIHAKRTHSLGDETDGNDISLGGRLATSSTTTSQVDGSSSRNSRVTRSQSVDSALSKVGRSHQQPLNQSIIYEMDSEEEDHLLMAAQNTTAGDHLLHPEAMDFEKESSTELEEGSARARAATQKRKTAATTTTGVTRGRKASSASTGSTAAVTKTTAARGRKKLRKDSESMEVEID